MRITARFASACARCGERIEIDAEVEWEQRVGTAHPECVRELAAPRANPRDLQRLAELRAKREAETRVRAAKLRAKGTA